MISQIFAFRHNPAKKHFAAGVRYRAQNQFDAALEEYWQAAQLLPGSVASEFFADITTATGKRLPDTIEVCSNYLILHPEDAKMRYLLGLALEQTGQQAEAQAEWQKVLAIDEGGGWAYRVREHFAS